jgi:uncharacterized protein (TIGR03437 family)
VKTLFSIVLTLGLLVASAAAQPAVTAVVNGASFSFPPLQNSSIAQGSFFSIFGTGIGPAASACGTNLVNCIWDSAGASAFPSSANPLPTSIQGTSVSVTVGGTPFPAYLEYVSSSQINAVLPSNTPTTTTTNGTSNGTLTVTFNGQTSATFPVTVVASSFGTFTWNEAGTGPGIITNAVTYQRLTPFVTVAPGDYVTIWGTGLGAAPNASTEATAPPPQTNLCAAAANCPVTVWVAGLKATVTYAGRSGFTAEDQIDFIVPPGVQGCYVEVAVQTGQVISNFTSMAVDANRGICSDVDGTNFNDIASVVQSKGQVNVGDITLYSDYLNVSAAGTTAQWDNDTVSGDIATYTKAALQNFQGFTRSPSVNNCAVNPFLQYPPPTDPGLASVTFLDAGPSLKIQGPNGSQTVAQNSGSFSYGAQPAGNLTSTTGLVGGVTVGELADLLLTGTCPSTATDNCLPYFLTPTSAISQGQYTVTGSGGASVGALTAAVTVTPAAAAFQWTNQKTVTAAAIPRDQSLTITWSGGDPNGYVDITAISSTLATGLEPAANTPGVMVQCIAPVSTGSFEIPAYVLESLPSTAGSTAVVPPGELLVGPAGVACSSNSATSTTCPADLTLPSGLDAFYIFYRFILGQNVIWQ